MMCCIVREVKSEQSLMSSSIRSGHVTVKSSMPEKTQQTIGKMIRNLRSTVRINIPSSFKLVRIPLTLRRLTDGGKLCIRWVTISWLIFVHPMFSSIKLKVIIDYYRVLRKIILSFRTFCIYLWHAECLTRSIPDISTRSASADADWLIYARTLNHPWGSSPDWVSVAPGTQITVRSIQPQLWQPCSDPSTLICCIGGRKLHQKRFSTLFSKGV